MIVYHTSDGFVYGKTRQGTHASVFTVDCHGAQHRIALTVKGQLVAIDHSLNFDRERKFALLGGKMPVCHTLVTQALYSASLTPTLPRDFQLAAKRAHALRSQRAARFPYWPKDVTTRDKYAAYTRLEVARHFPDQCYAKGCVRTGPTYEMPPKGTYNLELELYGTGYPGVDSSYLFGARMHSSLRIRLPTRWWRSVHMKGIHVVGGHFVLDAYWHDDVADLMVLWQNKRTKEFQTLSAPGIKAHILLSDFKHEVTFYAPWSIR